MPRWNKERGRADIQACGAVWQHLAPKAAALFRRCQLFKPTQSLPTSLLLILSFSLILTFFPPYPCFCWTRLPLCVSAHAPATTYGCVFAAGRREKRTLGVETLGCTRKDDSPVTLHVFFFSLSFLIFHPKYFPPAFSRANILSRCNGAALDLGPKQNGG